MPYPILQMENNEVQKGTLTHIKVESGSKREGWCWRSCLLRRLQILADALPCLQLPVSYPWKRECPTPCLGPGCEVPPAIPFHLQIHKHVGEMGAGIQLVKHCLPSRHSGQEWFGFQKGWQKGLSKGWYKGPGSRSRKEGASWASLVIAITRT